MIGSLSPLFEYATWFPYNVINSIRDNQENPISIDLNCIGVNSKFILYLPEKDMGLSEQIRTFGFREPLNCKYYMKFITKNDMILDLGANIGFFTILSGHSKELICVEPLEGAIQLLKRNIEVNGLKEKTTVIQAAVGNKKKLLLEVNPQMNLSKIVFSKTNNTIEVDAIPLKQLVQEYQPNTVRIDVEGYEYEILMNAIPDNIKKIAMEFHAGIMGKGKTIEMLEYFDNQQFKVDYLVEDLPLRLYPFQPYLQIVNYFNYFAYVKRNLDPADCIDFILCGRPLKYLMLSR